MNDIAAPVGGKNEGRQVGHIGPIELEIIRHRLEAINADACDTLVRVSGSQIASEANDLNTSLMTADGTVLVAGKYTMVLSTSLNCVVADKPLDGWWQVPHATVLFTLSRLSQNSTLPSVAPLSVMRLLAGVLTPCSTCGS